MSTPSVEFIESIENKLWDVITEFHFLLKNISDWDWDDIILQDKMRRLHGKLKEIVLEIILECMKIQGGIR